QHYWAMSVQGQFFFVTPLIAAGLLVVARGSKRRLQQAALLTALGIFGLSLWFSIRATAANQAFAYFDTRARGWEFALGALVAVALPWLQLSRPLRLVAGWLGLAVLVS